MTSNQRALVTGASRGIGAAIAKRLVADGFFVIGSATSDAGVSAIEAMLGTSGEGVVLNLEDRESISQATESILERHETLAVLVSNAGITRDNLFMRMSDDDWASVIQTNLTSLHGLVRPFVRNMIRSRQGRIINIGSVVARSGNPGQANYVASKAGIEGFTRALAIEVASRGITVNCVAPGFIETDLTNAINEKQKAALLDRIPLGYIGSVDDVANAVSFLASDESRYITAQTIHVNGGLFPA